MLSETQEIQILKQQLEAVSWPIMRYEFNFTVRTTIRLPDYAGSMLRGAFGRALRRIACMTRKKDCKDCPLYRTCPYTCLFEAPAPDSHQLQKFSQIPNPYVIEPPVRGEKIYYPGERLSFRMVLIGRAIEHLALVVYAVQRAFSYNVGHGIAQLDYVSCVLQDGKTVEIYQPDQSVIQKHSADIVVFPQKEREVNLHFSTPLRLQDNGRALGVDQIDARTFLMALVRRISLLMEFHQKKEIQFPFSTLNKLAESAICETHLQWSDWVRYSSRQKQKMHLGGVTGRVTFTKLDDVFYPLLYIGQWLHVGKNASFGLGQYQILSK